MDVVDFLVYIDVVPSVEDFRLFEADINSFTAAPAIAALISEKAGQAANLLRDEERDTPPGVTFCHPYHTTQWVDVVTRRVVATMRSFYDFQAFGCVFLSNPSPTYGEFGPLEIHPNAVAVEVPRTLADCRIGAHPLGRGVMSQW